MTNEEKDLKYRKVIFKTDNFSHDDIKSFNKKGWLHEYGLSPHSDCSNNSKMISSAIIESEDGRSYIVKIGNFIFVD